jgi:hypothetical protein
MMRLTDGDPLLFELFRVEVVHASHRLPVVILLESSDELEGYIREL